MPNQNALILYIGHCGILNIRTVMMDVKLNLLPTLLIVMSIDRRTHAKEGKKYVIKSTKDITQFFFSSLVLRSKEMDPLKIAIFVFLTLQPSQTDKPNTKHT